jgi:hypothetical protein
MDEQAYTCELLQAVHRYFADNLFYPYQYFLNFLFHLSTEYLYLTLQFVSLFPFSAFNDLMDRENIKFWGLVAASFKNGRLQRVTQILGRWICLEILNYCILPHA